MCILYPVSSSGNMLQTIVRYHNQDIELDTVKIQNSSNPQGFALLPFYSHSHFPATLISSLTSGSSVLHFKNSK